MTTRDNIQVTDKTELVYEFNIWCCAYEISYLYDIFMLLGF